MVEIHKLLSLDFLRNSCGWFMRRENIATARQIIALRNALQNCLYTCCEWLSRHRFWYWYALIEHYQTATFVSHVDFHGFLVRFIHVIKCVELKIISIQIKIQSSKRNPKENREEAWQQFETKANMMEISFGCENKQLSLFVMFSIEQVQCTYI